MKQRIIGKALAVAVILLFVGLGIQPAIATLEPEQPVNDDCDICPKVSKSHIIILKNLISRLEKYGTQLSVLSKQYPEFEKKYQEISNTTQYLKDINSGLSTGWGYPIICFILNVLMIKPLILFGFGSSLGSLGLWFRVIGLIGYFIVMITVPIIYAIIDVGTIFDCNWWFIST
jgi:hypothetical protein